VEYRPGIPRAAVPELLRRTSVVVQASENENFGSSVAEALACGVPVVLGSSNGTGEYIDANSEVFDSYTPESVAAAILHVVEARAAEPERVSRDARAAAERSFSAGTVVDRLLGILAEVAPEGGRSDASSRREQTEIGA
jgi:glycosyltransferase involved in cell wall biosynthesis